MPIKLATHLYRNRHGMFYFRFVIPKDIKSYLDKSEFRFSLKTEQRHDAIYFAAKIIANLPQLTANLRRMKNDDETPPTNHLGTQFLLMMKNVALEDKIKHLQQKLDEQNELMTQMVWQCALPADAGRKKRFLT